jgi:hypothetical protein
MISHRANLASALPLQLRRFQAPLKALDELAPLGLDQRLKPAKESTIRPKPNYESTSVLRAEELMNERSTVASQT